MRWSLLFVLLALACKPAVRKAPQSDLHAIADDSLTLGVTPVEKDDVQAYRLLVCKKAMSYPKWMLEDNNRCLPGLVTEEGDEVIILPDHLKRDFAAKYEGYAKASTWVVPAFALAAIGVVFGPRMAESVAKIKPVEVVGKKATESVQWVTTRGFVTTSTDFVKSTFGSVTDWFGNTVRGVIRKVPDRFKLKLDDTAVSDRVVFYYRVEAKHAVAKLKKTGDNINGARKKVRSLEEIEKLRASYRTKNLLQKQTKLKDTNAVNARIANLNKQIDDEFMKKYEEVKNVQILGGDALSDRIKDMRKYHEMKSTREVISLLETNKADMPGLANSISLKRGEIDTRISEAKEVLTDGSKHNVEFGPTGLRHADVRRGTIAGGVGTVAAYGVMVSFDKSIWGYSDRQVSKHWSQIFHDQDDFGADSTSVRDIPGILRSLADAYGFTVNSKAIALGN